MRDLFGEVPVSIDDVLRWLEIVNFHCAPFRVAYYVLNWNVVDKIRAAKLDGTWEGLDDGRYDILAFDLGDRRVRLRALFGFTRYIGDEFRAGERIEKEKRVQAIGNHHGMLAWHRASRRLESR